MKLDFQKQNLGDPPNLPKIFTGGMMNQRSGFNIQFSPFLLQTPKGMEEFSPIVN